jgi:hypothetical protein
MNNNAQKTNVLSDSDREMAEMGIIDLPDNTHPNNQGSNDDEDENFEEDENEEKGAGAGQNNSNTAPKTEEKKDETVVITAGEEDDITEEALLKHLQKKGIKVESLKDLNKPAAEKVLTAEEAAEATEKKKTDAIKFGFDKKLFSKKDYDAFQALTTANKADVVKDAFIASLKTENPDLDDSDALDTFNSVFHLYEDEESVKYKLGQKQIEQQFQDIVNSQFSNIVKVEELYDGVQKNLQRAEVFTGLVNTAFDKLPATQTIKVDKEDINITLYTPEQLKAAKENYLTAEMMHSVLTEDGTIDEAALLQEVEKDLFYENRFAILEEAAKTLADRKVTAHKIGRKAANFNEDHYENQGGSNRNPDAKSDSDRELEKAQDEGVI